MTAPPVEILCDAALFLDFDGTLVSLADRPDAVHVDAALRRLLADLHHALNGRLAIVSGRSVETLIDDFGLGDFIIAGTHGLQYHQPGLAMDAPVRLQAVDHAQRAMESFASDKPGVFVERKTLSVGLHFRLGERWTRECEALALQLADELGLYVQAGKAIFELRPGGADKGSAVRRLMDLPVMSGGSPVFIGDDVTGIGRAHV